MYQHYGRIGDIWKHFPLVDVLDIERPSRYVETNSSRAEHVMDDDWRRSLGIGHFLSLGNVADSQYVAYERESLSKGTYLGSCALAMKLLGNRCRQYVLCDLDSSALDDMARFARQLGLEHQTQIFCGDSRSGLYDRMSDWGEETFVHIDPYDVLALSENGCSYGQLFFDLAAKGVKVFLWYGYSSVDGREALDTLWASQSKGLPGSGRFEVEIDGFEDIPEEASPGVMGCGILGANLLPESISRIQRDHEIFCRHYRQVEAKGTLYRYKGRTE